MSDTEVTDPLTLDTVCNGAARELFQQELDRVLRNVLDPNTKAEEKRSITLTLTMHPSEDRDSIKMVLDSKAVLAPNRGAGGVAFVGQNGRTGEIVATVYNAKQLQLGLSAEPPKPTVLPKAAVN